MYWALLIVGILATAVFLVLRVQRGGIAALYAKAVASLCFIATAIAATNENRLFLDFGSWMTFGLVFGLLGDVWLDLKWIYLQDKDSYLYSGFIFFLLGHDFVYPDCVCGDFAGKAPQNALRQIQMDCVPLFVYAGADDDHVHDACRDYGL